MIQWEGVVFEISRNCPFHPIVASLCIRVKSIPLYALLQLKDLKHNSNISKYYNVIGGVGTSILHLYLCFHYSLSKQWEHCPGYIWMWMAICYKKIITCCILECQCNSVDFEERKEIQQAIFVQKKVSLFASSSFIRKQYFLSMSTVGILTAYCGFFQKILPQNWLAFS